MNELLDLLALHGGEIVCTASLDTDNINQARASGRMYVREDGIGFVWMPGDFKDGPIPTTPEEVELFEKWFPLEVELPESLKTPDFLFSKQKYFDVASEKEETSKFLSALEAANTPSLTSTEANKKRLEESAEQLGESYSREEVMRIMEWVDECVIRHEDSLWELWANMGETDPEEKYTTSQLLDIYNTTKA